jgi:hypothetical protein
MTFGQIAAALPPSLATWNDPTTLSTRDVQNRLVLLSGTLNTSQAPPVVGTAVQTGGVIFAGSSTTAASIRDGASFTYLFGEKYVPTSQYTTGTWAGDSKCAYVGDSADTLRGGQRIPEPDTTPLPTAAASQPPLQGIFGGPHNAVFNVALCDGAVRQIGFDIDATLHFRLAARADGGTIQVPD